MTTKKELDNKLEYVRVKAHNEAIYSVISVLNKFIKNNEDTWNPLIFIQCVVFKKLVPTIEKLVINK